MVPGLALMASASKQGFTELIRAHLAATFVLHLVLAFLFLSTAFLLNAACAFVTFPSSSTAANLPGLPVDCISGLRG